VNLLDTYNNIFLVIYPWNTAHMGQGPSAWYGQ